MASLDINISEIEFLQPPFNSRFIDITGQTFNRLTVLGAVERRNKRILWLCQCDCGEFSKVVGSELRTEHTKSCGCLKRDTAGDQARTHGMSHKSSEYRTWCAIRSRCSNPNLFQWKDYGGRGISICERWQESFENFLADMGEKPSPNHSIERRDNDGDYTPDNCYWATRLEQANNKSNTHQCTYLGKTQSLANWCRELHLNHRTIYTRLRIGWTFERAITTH